MDDVDNYDSTIALLPYFEFIGIGFTVGGVLLLLLATCMFPQWRKKYQNQLFVHFALTRCLSNLFCIFMLGFDDNFYFHDYINVYILLMRIMMSTVQMAASMLTLIFTKHLHNSFVVVICVEEEHKMLKQALFVWTTFVPLVLCITTMSMTIATIMPAVLPWPEFGLWYSITMKWPLIFANSVLYCKVVYCVLKTYNNTNRRNNKAIRTVAVFAVLFIVMALQSLVDEMRPIILKVQTHQESSIYSQMSFQVFVNFVLTAVSYVTCFLSTAYWLWGNAADRQMWSSFIESKVCKLRAIFKTEN
ncbi:hypothetical protein EVAR_27402_1 [Eumeta japonica]|uniref:Serpentine receptor class gamma n=1 Tax=Eumeta variegata TaxID=151549 RepID=A0A4C1X117_EUMVA|nr:hypothetical protein EVAR_27402_1 [Eumeta japonica]